jgi:hypothetical protein
MANRTSRLSKLESRFGGTDGGDLDIIVQRNSQSLTL